jgi:hypothetical protein
MFKSKFGIGSLAILAALAVAGCESRGTDEARRYAPPPVALAAGTHVDFALLKERVLTPSCTSCHAEFDDEAGVRVFVKPGDPGGSALYVSMTQGAMPPGGPPLADTVLDITREYIAELK